MSYLSLNTFSLVLKCHRCKVYVNAARLLSNDINSKYSDNERDKILKTLNIADQSLLSQYNVTQPKLKKFLQWKSSKNKLINDLSDITLINGFSEKTAKKLFDSILEGPSPSKDNKIRITGQILNPKLSDVLRESCKTVLACHISYNSICWLLIQKDNYSVLNWQYMPLEQTKKDGKLNMSDICEIATRVTDQLPIADIYVMKSESTTVRASGSNPDDPKVMTFNLQRSQLVSMVVALLNNRIENQSLIRDDTNEDTESGDKFKHNVYFLRSNLPFRLYGTLIGNEIVSTSQTVENLLRDVQSNANRTNKALVNISDNLIAMFKSANELEKDMLGKCLFLGLTFMELCIYTNKESMKKL